MTGPAGGVRQVLGPDELLIAAWLAWEAAPGAAWTAAAKTDALLACGLDLIGAHERIAAYRRAGYSVPDAIQGTVNGTDTRSANVAGNEVVPALRQQPGTRPPLTDPGDDMDHRSHTTPTHAEAVA